MPTLFEVDLDNSGRINHFVAASHPGEEITPQAIGEKLDGGERVLIKGIEYDLTETGNLVHPSVEVAGFVHLGNGIRLDEGTAFHPAGAGEDAAESSDTVWVKDHALVRGTEIQHGAVIGTSAFVLAQSIGHHTMVGSYVRIGANTAIGSDVVIGETTKIDVESQIGNDVVIGENARLGFNTRVCQGAIIGDRARIGEFTGAGPRGVNQDGPLILAGQSVPKSTHIPE